MARVRLKVAAGHYHLFHRAAPTIAKHKGCFEAEDLDVEISATGNDQSMREEEYPLIPGIPSDGSINAQGLQVLLNEEKSAGRVSKDMTIDKVLQLEPVKAAASAL